ATSFVALVRDELRLVIRQSHAKSRIKAKKKTQAVVDLRTLGGPTLRLGWQKSRGNQSLRRREEKWRRGFARNDRRELGPSIRPIGPRPRKPCRRWVLPRASKYSRPGVRRD